MLILPLGLCQPGGSRNPLSRAVRVDPSLGPSPNEDPDQDLLAYREKLKELECLNLDIVMRLRK
jgi:hypothetical protein